jgi:hypothetical protein
LAHEFPYDMRSEEQHQDPDGNSKGDKPSLVYGIIGTHFLFERVQNGAVQSGRNCYRSSAGRASDGQIIIYDQERNAALALIHEHKNEPYALEHRPIIAVAQANKLRKARCPRIRSDLETIGIMKFDRQKNDVLTCSCNS